MNTQGKDVADQMVRDSITLENDQKGEGLVDPGGFVLAEDDDLVSADDLGDSADVNDDEDDIIELTDMVELSPGKDVRLDDGAGDSSSLNTQAMEEEIIELVDAVKDAPEAEEEVLELTDVVMDDTFGSEAMPMVAAPGDGESYEGLVDEQDSAPDLSDDMGISIEEDVAEMQFVEETEAISEQPVETADIAIEKEQSETYDAFEEAEMVPKSVESFDDPVETADSDLEEAIRKKFSDEKIEAVITRVVQDTIEEKAGRILLEVAEAAIAKEIEKIKKAL
jgi:hypothetical protein